MNLVDLLLLIGAIGAVVISWRRDALIAGFDLFSRVLAIPIAGRVYEWVGSAFVNFIPSDWAGLVAFLSVYFVTVLVISVFLEWIAAPLRVGPGWGPVAAALGLVSYGVQVAVLALAFATYPAIDLRAALADSSIVGLSLALFGFVTGLLPAIFQLGEVALRRG